MATHHGKNGVVKIGANAVAEVRNFSYTIRADLEEDHAMGEDYKTRQVGFLDHSGSLTCHYDPSDTNGQDVLIAGASVTLLLYPEDGDGTGEVEVSLPSLIEEVSVNVDRDGINERSFSWQGNGQPTEGTA